MLNAVCIFTEYVCYVSRGTYPLHWILRYVCVCVCGGGGVVTVLSLRLRRLYLTSLSLTKEVFKGAPLAQKKRQAPPWAAVGHLRPLWFEWSLAFRFISCKVRPEND
jgi:hypothetical protein